MALYRIGEKAPAVSPRAFIANEATLMGEVIVGDRASIWPGSVVRADNEPVRIGANSNVQEGAVLHTDPGFPLSIGIAVTVGHQAMLHGCTIGDGSLVGIQAVVMNGAVIGADSLVGAGALVPEGKQFPDRSLIVGCPGKVVRQLTDAEIVKLRHSADVYVGKAEAFTTQLSRID